MSSENPLFASILAGAAALAVATSERRQREREIALRVAGIVTSAVHSQSERSEASERNGRALHIIFQRSAAQPASVYRPKRRSGRSTLARVKSPRRYAFLRKVRKYDLIFISQAQNTPPLRDMLLRFYWLPQRPEVWNRSPVIAILFLTANHYHPAFPRFCVPVCARFILTWHIRNKLHH